MRTTGPSFFRRLALALPVVLCGAAWGAGALLPRLDDKGDLMVPPPMKKALDELNPRFETWSASDYTARARQSSADTKSALAPFALLRDLNEDGRPDLILDGHDDKNALMVGIVSSDDGYVAKLISIGELDDPRQTVDWDGGKPNAGFNRYFMVREGRSDVFSVGYTELTAKNGDLASEGRIVDYIFADGEFTESADPL